ncbi:protein of unknown function [Candidatus Nitrosocosmicus franklandus]|uniref:Uncharacterized protein n=1 Tax=Candidatus Nitrosocosmicus franklandianus TaxID=1798806 RepID=A0A484I7S3_9ARCH|nr:protein of unknown function [Candidatus Nitrosocosmicus franklandus]
MDRGVTDGGEDKEAGPVLPPVEIKPFIPRLPADPPPVLILPPLLPEGRVDEVDFSFLPLVEKFLSIADLSSRITRQDKKFRAEDDIRNSPILEKYSLLSIFPCLNN